LRPLMAAPSASDLDASADRTPVTLSAATAVVRLPGQPSADLGAELIVLAVDSEAYFSLGGTGSRIWEIIENPTSIGGIVDLLMAEHDVTAARCEADVIAFVERLNDAGLVELR
jgi:hypothetical protein